LIPLLFGKHWKEVGSFAELKAQFADKQEKECMMITMEEVADAGKGGLWDEFKRMVTGGTKAHMLKHQTKDSCMKDFRNWVALVNLENKDKFTVAPGDRRVTMIEGSDAYSKRAQDEKRITEAQRKLYFEELWRAIEDESTVQWIARYLVHDVCLEDWAPEDIPKTQIRDDQQALHACSVQRFLEVWQSQTGGEHDLFFKKQVPKKDAHGVEQDGFQEETRPLKMSPHIGANHQYKPSDVFDAFRDWCKRANARMSGATDVNSFTQALRKYTHDKATRPQGILHKKRTNAGTLYWVFVRIGSTL
jgi:uncharacterized Ntn-hydrolase superfamily protein